MKKEEKSSINKEFPADQREICSPVEDEIDLADILAVFWRHRLLIVVVTLSVIAAGAVYCFTSTPLYEINAQVRPGVTSYTSNYKEKRSLTPGAIKYWFSKKAYASYLNNIAEEKHRRTIPTIRATTNRNSRIINLLLYWPDHKEGKILLEKALEAFSYTFKKNLKGEIAIGKNRLQQKIGQLKLQLQKIENNKNELKGDIKEKENKILLLRKRLDTLKENKKEKEKTKKYVETHLKEVYKNTDQFIKLRKEMITAGTFAGVDKFTLLMLSNIVQQNISYASNLEKRISTLEKEINDFIIQEIQFKSEIDKIHLAIAQLRSKLSKELPIKERALEKQIDVINSEIKTIQPLEIVQSPFSSPGPVKPRKKMIMALSAVIGFLLALFAAAFEEFWGHVKSKLSS